MQIALKIDVDTRVGTRIGAPRLLGVLARHRVRATFFVVLGPDNSGKAVFRVFRRRGFVGKMARTNPAAIYGLKTLLYGTVLPAPLTGLDFPETLRRIEGEGHELALHAYDHVLWQDHVSGWGPERATRELARGVEAFESVVGRKPRAVGAPGWQVSPASLEAQDRLGLSYASDSRGTGPFVPAVAGRRFRTLQIPGSLPTADELIGRDGATAADVLDRVERMLDPSGLNVFTGHAELEGMYIAAAFDRFLERTVASGARFVTLEEVARKITEAPRPPECCELTWGTLPGRAGTLACRGGPR